MRLSLRLILLISWLLFVSFLPTIATPAIGLSQGWLSYTSGNPLYDAWKNAQGGGLGSYRLQAEIEQTFIPRPSRISIAQQSQRIDLHLEGEVQLPDHSDLRLWAESNLLDVEPVRLIQDGDTTFMVKGEALVPVQDPLGAVSPTSDYLGFLIAAENIQELEPWSATNGERFQRYGFDVDGPRYAEHVRDVYTEQLRGQLPSRITLQPPEMLQVLEGKGELWIDMDGLPRRQILDFYLPKVNDDYGARVHMVVDFSDFGQVQTIGIPISDYQGDWYVQDQLLISLRQHQPGLHLSALLVTCLLVLSLMLAMTLYRRRRFTYPILAISVIFITAINPLLESQQIMRFDARRVEAAESRTTVLAEDLGLVSEQHKTAERLAETYQKILPVQPIQTQVSTQDYGTPICGEGAIDQDSDGDGMDDYQESCYGTYYLSADTDRDIITDTLEIRGIDIPDSDGNSVTWTSNPIRSDTNNDGLSDYSEWPSPIGEAPSWDPDNDTIPNIWDNDNDGDGVFDGADFSPYSVTDYTTNFQIQTQGGSYEGYQYIEVQVQPQDLDHLRYTTTYLDWPDDDLGQI
ncbi:MAG: hypothetical protein GY759_16650 [Chloroflexi bacterium]|nr:hypothetical protein [Chloroflexota bacterium]